MSNAGSLCNKCEKLARCPYGPEMKVGVNRRGYCAFGGVSAKEKVVVEKHKVNPLKASKKGAK